MQSQVTSKKETNNLLPGYYGGACKGENKSKINYNTQLRTPTKK